jgi:protein-L-isoaspartate(D-aspartate) O-methyltransferase
MIDYAVTRANMVENQLRPNRIDEPRLLRAMAEIPRERFVPESLRGCAYGDEDLALGGGRFLIEPLALAKLLQTAEVRPHDVVLALGDGTGYVTAILSRLAGSVFVLLPPGADPERVRGILAEFDCENVLIASGSATAGMPGREPFDLIVLAGSVPAVPPALLDQLGPAGRLVAVLEQGRSGKVMLARKVNGAVGRVMPFDAQVHRLPGLELEPGFSL